MMNMTIYPLKVILRDGQGKEELFSIPPTTKAGGILTLNRRNQ